MRIDWKTLGYKQIPTADPWLKSFVKLDEQGNPVRVNVWTNSKNNFYTVGTCLTHPSQGKTQLFRKFVNDSELLNIFKNPRVHTDKGYKIT